MEIKGAARERLLYQPRNLVNLWSKTNVFCETIVNLSLAFVNIIVIEFTYEFL